jgi:hypothetical protein
MDCQTVHDHLSTYLDHDVPLQTRRILEQHFESCPQCCHELAQLHTMTAWVRDFPLIEPSPMLLQHVREQVECLPHRSQMPLLWRLVGALPLQAAAVLVVVVSAALMWQMTLQVRRGSLQRVDPPAHIEPRISRERGMIPILDVQPFEPTFEESFPTPAPLVRLPSKWSGPMANEGFMRVGREPTAMPLLTGMAAKGRVGDTSLFPTLTLRATDPVQAAQQIWELVPRTGGALLQSQGMITPAGRALRGPVRLTLAITDDRYQSLLDAVRQLPGTAVSEERMAIIGRELPLESPGSRWRMDHVQPAKAMPMTMVITILPR